MRHKTKERRCSTCRFWQSIGADDYCDRIGMTGKSRVKEGLLSEGPYRPCKGWEQRNAEEQRRLVTAKRQGKFNAMLGDDVVIERTGGEKRRAGARDKMKTPDRGDMAKALGLSSKAAEALYGGGQL